MAFIIFSVKGLRRRWNRRFHAQKQAVVGLVQFGTQCVPIWKCLVESPHVAKVALIKTETELFGKHLHQKAVKAAQEGTRLFYNFNGSMGCEHGRMDGLQRSEILWPADVREASGDKACWTPNRKRYSASGSPGRKNGVVR